MPVRPRRRLGDLYVRGQETSLDDGSGEPVVFWLQKLNEIERDSVMRRASAAKARFALAAEQEEGEIFVAALGSMREYIDRQGQINIVIAEDAGKIRERIEAQLSLDEDGWGKDDKIKSLADAWTGDIETPGLAAAFAEDPNDPEAIRVKGELDAFEADVDRKVEQERADLVRDWETTPDNELELEATRVLLKRQASDAFMREYYRQHIFYSVRELDDHHKRYFGVIGEIDDLDDQVRKFLEDQCIAMIVGPSEGKASPPTPLSSISSETPSEPETAPASGPVAATA
jgi:hypothetical protein